VPHSQAQANILSIRSDVYFSLGVPVQRSALVKAIDGITSLDDPDQLRVLETFLHTITPSDFTPDLYRAVFGLFERFPEHDAYGVFASLVTLLERCPFFQPFLIESVRRRATEYNLTMVNRLLNGGFRYVASTDLAHLLKDAAEDPNGLASARAWAEGFLHHQRSVGRIA
jgi:hypothetical protein